MGAAKLIHETVWPECFITGVINPTDPDLILCADALLAWSIVTGGKVAGHPPPPKLFGDVMAKIAARLNVSGTPESFMEYANVNLAEQDI